MSSKAGGRETSEEITMIGKKKKKDSKSNQVLKKEYIRPDSGSI